MSTVDRVQRELTAELLGGRLAPGTRLGQDDVARRLGVSKIPVREAHQRLAALGLLRFESNRGAFVPQLAVDDAVEIFAMRRAIEPRLLERSIERLTIVDLAEAEQALTADIGSAETNWRLHRALYRAADWQRGLVMVEILHAALAPYVVLHADRLGGADHSAAEHVGLVDACRRRDSPAALGLLDIHLGHAERLLVEYRGADDSLTDRQTEGEIHGS